MGHFMGDPQTYRPDEDEEAALARDSIDRLESRLHDHGVDDEALAEIRDEVEARVEDAISWAKEQPHPDPEDAYDDVFVNPPSGVTTEEPEFNLAEVNNDD
ncbi:pyruvate dehydrogenase (acetyl-transferring) [Halorubrum tebenquichense DSM 14210]|uniref:Pyruvate dehydrogenase (Acetyl-transferring) n=1 Tax=Halorubrum tebenquichense DSM 14210 TaxID=1227485 RepID=M0DCP3_9EURY|nr:pyruvate dehydrogenase (acetyl-transferring) [Halorubrum tebenquichense DSM 14210]